MSLIKYCDEKYRIDITKTIRLGTFYDYRNHEKNEIQDGNEGIADGRHVAPDKTIHPTPEEVNLANIGIKVTSIDNKKTKISLKDIQITGKTELPNCYLFSCSESPFNSNLLKKFDYESHYEITDTQKFSDILTKSLGTKLQDTLPYARVMLDAYWQKVEYVTSNTPDPLEIHPRDFAKKKPEFASECEYRLIFIVTNSNQIVSIEDKPIDLEVTDELRRCCTWN